jgi:DNA-binding transcriptional ArsR family regulator
MSLPAVMKHVAVLEAAGVIRTQKVGRVRTCTLAPGSLDVLGAWVAQQRTAWERALDDLGAFIETQTKGNDHD